MINSKNYFDLTLKALTIAVNQLIKEKATKNLDLVFWKNGNAVIKPTKEIYRSLA